MTHPPRDPDRILLNRPPRSWPRPAEDDPMPVRTYEDCLIDEYTRPLADAVAAQMTRDADTAVREVRADRARMVEGLRALPTHEECIDCGRRRPMVEMHNVGCGHYPRWRCLDCVWQRMQRGETYR